MLGNLTRSIFGKRKKSQSLARSRLHFVLVQDRTGLSNDELGDFRTEMMEVIEKYFVVDKQGFDIEHKREGDSSTLLINSPIVVRRQEGYRGRAGAKRRHTRGNPKNEDKAATAAC